MGRSLFEQVLSKRLGIMLSKMKIAAIEEFVLLTQPEEPEEFVEVAAAETYVEPEEVILEEVAEVIEEPVEEPVVEPVEEIVAEVPAAPKKQRAPAKPFDFKIVYADEITQDRYNELKNYAMQYKKVKSRISKKFDSLNSGRIQFVKFGLAGRTLKVYCNLNLDDVDPKYHCKDQSFKKPYVQVPVLIRVKSGRALKYAKRLIDQTATACGLKANQKYEPQDYIIDMENIYKENLANGNTLDEAALSDAEE